MTQPLRVDLIDISHYNSSSIDFKAMKSKGLKGVYHKCTEGSTWADELYSKHRVEVNNSGLKFGAYHFVSADSSSTAYEQAKWFLSKASVKQGDLIPMIDFEESGLFKWSEAKRTAFIHTFSSVIEKSIGVKPILYIPSDMNLSSTLGLKLWVPRYSNSNTPPAVPKPFKSIDVRQFSNGVYGVPNSFCGFHGDLNTLTDIAKFNELIIPTKGDTKVTHSWNSKTSYQGKTVNWLGFYLIASLNKMLKDKKNGAEKEDATLVQGGYNAGGVAASAGTHDGGGAFDFTPFNYANRVRCLRLLGVAAWHRTPSQGPWREHIHGIVDGDGTASSGAKAQVVDYHNHKNGLANHAADDGYKMLVFPKFVYPESKEGKTGKFWVKRNVSSYQQQTHASKKIKDYKKGDVVNIVAVTSTQGIKQKFYWGITADAQCISMSALSSSIVKADTVVVTPPVTPPVKKTIDYTIGHASMQFSDNDNQKLYDVEKIVKRAVDNGIAYVGGTEAASGAGNLGKYLNDTFTKNGYKFALPKGQDSWIAVKSDLIKPGTFSVFYEEVIDGRAKEFSSKGLFYVKYFDVNLNRNVYIFGCHYLTHGRPGGSKDYVVYLPQNTALAKAIDKKVVEVTADGSLAFYTGDQNIVDKGLGINNDTFFGGVFTSSWDELRHWENTGHGNIDVIACYDPKHKTKAKSTRAFDDEAFFLNTDHFYIEAVYTVTV